MRAVSVLLALSAMLTVEQRDAIRSSLDPASASVSADGRFIAFTTYSQLAPADTDQRSDVYVLDRARQQVALESVDIPGLPREEAHHPRLSGDGRFLVYQSAHSIVIRDRSNGTAQQVAEGRQPTVSHDGSTVAFTSHTGVYSVRVKNDQPRKISLDLPGTDNSRAQSVTPSLSANGQLVAFSARLPRTPSSNPDSYVFVRDISARKTLNVARGWTPALSGDGRFVVYVDRKYGVSHVFLTDLRTHTTEMISRHRDGARANGDSANPSVSFDGRFVVFQSAANNLVDAEDFNLLPDVFIVDRSSRTISRVSGDPDSAWMEPSAGPSIDAAGTVVAFSSRHPTDASDKGNDFDLYVATLERGALGLGP